MKIIFMRHGECSNNLHLGKPDYEELREPDPALSERGVRQIQLAAKHLKRMNETYEAVYCSPQTRAVQSA